MQTYQPSNSRQRLIEAAAESGELPSLQKGPNEGARSFYSGLSGSPDTRREFYRSPRREHRQQHSPSNRALTTKPQHKMNGSMQRMRASEPIYWDIDPSIRQAVVAGGMDSEAICTRHESASHQSPQATACEIHNSPQTNGIGSDPRLVVTPPFLSTAVTTRPPSRTSTASGSSLTSPYNRSNHNTGHSPQPVSPSHTALQSTVIASQISKKLNDSLVYDDEQPSYVSPYVSPIAQEYGVLGGMFPGQAATTPRRGPSQYDERHIMTHSHSNRRQFHDNTHAGLIMFGDDYDLGSITTGASQQELLQKRRDVKKRRDTKKKPKKHKERIINMPPRLLQMGSWDTTPIAKTAVASNSNKEKNKWNNHHQASAPSRERKDQKRQGQPWNIIKAFQTSLDEETGSTDASTRESDGAGNNQHDPNHVSTSSDNISLNSFPLLSTSAKEGIGEEIQTKHDAHVHHTHAGRIPRLMVGESKGLPPVDPQYNYHPEPVQGSRSQGATVQPLRSPHNQSPQMPSPRAYYPQQHDRARSRSQHMDIYQRQHGEELQKLEHHLRYLQEQHQQLEQTIQDRINEQKQEPNQGYEDDRPRAVRFAPKIANSFEVALREISYDESGFLKESPTSVAQAVTGLNNDSLEKSTSQTSILSPQTLFPDKADKPKSILRRKGNGALDATGRYPGAVASRGRSAVPVFVDSNGREVSPIRSPARQKAQHQAAIYKLHSTATDDLSSIPDNPDHKDIAVLFDSDPDADVGFAQIRREIDDDSGVISDAFIEAVAAIVLQTAIRRFLAIRRVERMNRACAVNSQKCSPRKELPSFGMKATMQQSRTIHEAGIVDVREHEQEDFFYDLAAIQIQSVFRGWWVRDSLAVDEYCSTLLQKTFRGFRARMEYDYDLYRIILVQAIWRRKIAVRARRNLTAKLGKSSGTNEETGVLMPDSSDEAFRIQQVGAIIIQTYWRSYVGRICYMQSISDIVVVQSIVRRWLTYRSLGVCTGRTQTISSPVGSDKTDPRQSRQRMGMANRSGTQITKFDFDSRNVSSLATDGLASSNRKTKSTDGRSPSFRMLQDDSSEQPNGPSPARRTPGLASAPRRDQFSDRRSSQRANQDWNKSDRSAYQSKGSSNSQERPISPNVKSYGEKMRDQTQKQHGLSPMSGQGRSNSDHYHANSVKQLSSSASSNQGADNNYLNRAKGWNVDEEIDKEGTRNLLMAWKQKDKANSFTIGR